MVLPVAPRQAPTVSLTWLSAGMAYYSRSQPLQYCRPPVEAGGFEPPTSSVRLMRSPTELCPQGCHMIYVRSFKQSAGFEPPTSIRPVRPRALALPRSDASRLLGPLQFYKFNIANWDCKVKSQD